jgi:hypothetical protein
MNRRAAVLHDPPVPFHLLLGQPCWAVAAGAGTGSLLSLHFGRKLPRIPPINNPAVTPELRNHEGEAVLFIECRWSVTSKAKALFDTDGDGSAAAMTKAAKRLAGASVRQVNVEIPPRAFSLHFDNGLTLGVTADDPDPEDPHDNYTFAAQGRSFVIGQDLRLRVEPRRGVNGRRVARGRVKLSRQR